MDFHALFKIIQIHPSYKSQGDSVRQQILSCLSQGGLCWSELSRRLQEFHPDIRQHLETQRDVYKIQCDENRQRRQQGEAFLVFGEASYPRGFYLTENPPLTLSYLGFPRWNERPSLSVVGSREAREESLIWMEKELGAFVEKSQVPLVSGGARGIDQKAHAVSLRKNLPTTVILPSGLGALYPENLQHWRRPVLDAGGCFLSEYPFGQKMQKYLFHHRNRLIAALGEMVLVVEARQRSGTLITAELAARWGRPVLVVPGHPHDSHFGGSLHLLTEGAVLVRDAQDLDSIFQAELWSRRDPSVSIEVKVEPEHYG